MRKRVLVLGAFDGLTPRQVHLLQTAGSLGDILVCVESDETVAIRENRPPTWPQEQRLHLVRALACVTRAVTAQGTPPLVEKLREMQPDVLVIDAAGDVPEARRLCESLGIDYFDLACSKASALMSRACDGPDRRQGIPYRIDLAGGWLDQPFVSRHAEGSVVVASIVPDSRFPARCGMASSTRESARRIWPLGLPQGDPEQMAKLLFAYENPPGKEEIAGSQDAIGIVFPGVSRLDYRGCYWPERIASRVDEETLAWLERLLQLRLVGPRPMDFSVLSKTSITTPKVRALSAAAEACWAAILAKDAGALGQAVHQSFLAQVAMFPQMVNSAVAAVMEDLRRRSLGSKVTGAGGGGFVLAVCEEPLEGCLPIRIVRPTTGAASAWRTHGFLREECPERLWA